MFYLLVEVQTNTTVVYNSTVVYNTTVIYNTTNATFVVTKNIFILQPTTLNVERGFSKFNVYFCDHYFVNLYSSLPPLPGNKQFYPALFVPLSVAVISIVSFFVTLIIILCIISKFNKGKLTNSSYY